MCFRRAVRAARRALGRAVVRVQGRGGKALAVCLVACAAATAGAACGPRAPTARSVGANGPADGARAAEDEELPSRASYGSEPEPPPDPTVDGAGDGLAEAKARVERRAVELAARRGDRVIADGRLADLARWGAEQLSRGRPPSAASIDRAARRVGHVGATPVIVLLRAPATGAVDPQGVDDGLEREYRRLPSNTVFTRYGVGGVERAGEAYLALALASVEVTLAPVPKHVRPGETIRLAGHATNRFDRVRLAVTGPAGRVRSEPLGGRAFDVELVLSEPGVHRVELVGDGRTGPVVLANIPLYAGVAEPPLDDGAATGDDFDGGATTADGAERRIVDLLNRARAQAGAPPLEAQAELATIARAHSRDMSTGGFFGHVSPSSGGPEDRVRRAGVRVSRLGEDVACAASPDEAFAALMQSPAHRANIIDPAFTRVGAGAAIGGEPSSRLVYVTVLFAAP